MNNAPDYENNLAFSPKDTNYDILKEYEAHGEPLPSYNEYMELKHRAKMQGACEDDIGKLCKFWDDDGFTTYNILEKICSGEYKFQTVQNTLYSHCRRLTEQEIEELC